MILISNGLIEFAGADPGLSLVMPTFAAKYPISAKFLGLGSEDIRKCQEMPDVNIARQGSAIT